MEQLEKHQQQLFEIVNGFTGDYEGKSEELKTYESVIGMVYTLILDKRINEVDAALKETFPEFYSILA